MSKSLSLYLAHPLTGSTVEDAQKYYATHVPRLEEIGLKVFDPLTMERDAIDAIKGKIPSIQAVKSNIYFGHSIFQRDKWACTHADIILVDLLGSKRLSVGCIMELAWTDLTGIHTVVLMEEDNIHRHDFVLEAADTVLTSFDDALVYLNRVNR